MVPQAGLTDIAKLVLKSLMGKSKPAPSMPTPQPQIPQENLFKLGPHGNHGTMRFPYEANQNPGIRHPNAGPPNRGPNRSDNLKYSDAILDQKVRAKGLDPSIMDYWTKHNMFYPPLR